MATDKQLYNRYVNLLKESNILLKNYTNEFINGFIKFYESGNTGNIATAFEKYYDKAGFRGEMATLTQATEIKQAAIPFGIKTAKLPLMIENTNDKLMSEIFGKTNGKKLSNTIYKSVDSTKKIIYNELAKVDKEIIGFKNSVKNMSNAIGGNIDQQKQVAKYMIELEQSAKNLLKNSSDKNLKEFRKNVGYAQKQVDSLTENRQLGRKQQAALNQIVKGAEKKSKELIEKGVARAVKAKNESNMQRLVLNENTRVFQTNTFVARKDDGVTTAVKFIKNPRHKIYDMCDIIERTDSYGLGAGVFPLENQLGSPVHVNWQGYWRAITFLKIPEDVAKSRGKYTVDPLVKQAEKEGFSKSGIEQIKDIKQQKYVKINTDKLKSLDNEIKTKKKRVVEKSVKNEPVKKATPKPVKNVDLGFNKKYNTIVNEVVNNSAYRVIDKLSKPKSIKSGAGSYSSFGKEVLARVTEPDVFVHEYGHFIDDNLGIASKKLESAARLDADKIGVIKNKRIDFAKLEELKNEWQKMEDVYYKAGKNKGKYRGKRYTTKTRFQYSASDIIDSMSAGYFQSSYNMPGHGLKYYKHKGMMESENFANLFLFYSDDELWKEAQKLFPNLTKQFKEIMEEI